MNSVLPIQAHIKEIKAALKTDRYAVIQAPPGAGKTTRIPLALLNESWLADKKIILLEPRRLAAISCAGHMSDLVKEPVGQTIGYQIRLDRKISAKTKIEVVTEGIFTRKIQNDPSLEDVGLVIFDEFHERNIHSDVGLAFCLDTFEALRDDLRMLVMSATMDVGTVSKLMGGAPIIDSRGKSYPVKTIYQEPVQRRGQEKFIHSSCLGAVKQALKETIGDILVFLPGVREIKQTQSLLEEINLPGIYIQALYGSLSAKEQARAIAPSPAGKRKIVLATSIAETSITIQGVDTVIDSGLMRIPKFSWKSGMSRLETVSVSKASADQRRGRSGRMGPGTCYRLWSEYDQGLLKAFSPPEILSVDLASVALELVSWGVSDPLQLSWLDPPDKVSFKQAMGLLKSLGAIDKAEKITKHGRKMAVAGLHPRLAHMIIIGGQKGHGALACRIAAFLNERDFIRFEYGESDPDIRLRMEWIEAVGKNKPLWQKGFKINKGIIRRILKTEKKIKRDFKINGSRLDIEKTGMLLAHAYPDRIAKKRDNQSDTFLTSAGKGVYFPFPCEISMSEYVVAVHLDGSPKNAKIFLGAPYDESGLEEDFGALFKSQTSLDLDRKSGRIQAENRVVFQKLIIKKRHLKEIDPDMACDVLINHIRNTGLHLLPWSKKLNALKDRIAFLSNSGQAQGLPDVSDEALIKTLDTWLKPFLTGIMSLKQLEKMDLDTSFLSLLTWEQQKIIDKKAPTHIIVPSGSKRPLRYRQGNSILDSPVLEVRLQEMFGLVRTPVVAGGKVPLTISLLSPAGRPVQITRDLESFWENTYKEVKKDLAGRYPKHYWPDDPLSATPTSRVKPKKLS